LLGRGIATAAEKSERQRAQPVNGTLRGARSRASGASEARAVAACRWAARCDRLPHERRSVAAPPPSTQCHLRTSRTVSKYRVACGSPFAQTPRGCRAFFSATGDLRPPGAHSRRMRHPGCHLASNPPP
jgi:hypothetical protein